MQTSRADERLIGFEHHPVKSPDSAALRFPYDHRTRLFWQRPRLEPESSESRIDRLVASRLRGWYWYACRHQRVVGKNCVGRRARKAQGREPLAGIAIARSLEVGSSDQDLVRGRIAGRLRDDEQVVGRVRLEIYVQLHRRPTEVRLLQTTCRALRGIEHPPVGRGHVLLPLFFPGGGWAPGSAGESPGAVFRRRGRFCGAG